MKSIFLFLLLCLSLTLGQRIFFEKYNNEVRRLDDSNSRSPFQWFRQLSRWYHEMVNNIVYYYYEFLNYFGVVEEIPEQVILRFASTQSPVTYLTKPTTNSPHPSVSINLDSVMAAMGVPNGESNVILNNEVLNNLPDDMKTKLLNNKNLTQQLMQMQPSNIKDNNGNQYMYDEKDYTEPAGRDY